MCLLSALCKNDHTHFVNVRDKLPLGRVPRLLLGSSQLGLDVEQLHLKIGSLCVPGEKGGDHERREGDMRQVGINTSVTMEELKGKG